MNWALVFAMFFVTLVLVLAGIGMLYFCADKLRGNFGFTAGKDEMKKGLAELSALEQALSQGIEGFSALVPLSEAKQLREQTQTLALDIKKDHDEYLVLEQNLVELQKEVSEKERALISIRQAQEETQTFVREIKGKSEELRKSNQQMRIELDQSIEQLASLASKAKVSAEQQASLLEIEATMKGVSKQIGGLGDVHNKAVDRLLNLDGQYKSLEEEYEKIVALELSGAD